MQNCTNCGAQLTPTARFCPNCAAPADAEVTRVASEETHVRPTQTPQPVVPMQRMPEPPIARVPSTHTGAEDVERVVFTVRPTLLFIKLGYVLAALIGILLMAAFTIYLPDFSFFIPLAIALALLFVPAYFHIRRQMLRYTLTDAKIEIDEGFLSQTTRNIPLRNIQDVTVKTTLFQRLLGFGDVVIDNAGGEGGTTILNNIPEPRKHMDMLLRELRRWR